jgi:capsule polysaccharide export protein KpsE/RkpR
LAVFARVLYAIHQSIILSYYLCGLFLTKPSNKRVIIQRANALFMDQQRDSLIGVLKTIWQWRKAIRNVCGTVLVGSIIVSLFLSNYYKSTTICYPASPKLANPELLFGTSGEVTEYYGTDQDLDRLAEIANGNQLVDYMVSEFKLYEHYGIDSTSKEGPYKVREEFRDLYVAQKNKNDALDISVEDTDPKFAALMCNAAREKTDEIARRLTTNSQGRLLAALEDNINRKKIELTRLGDSLRIMQAFYGIYDPTAQGEQLAKSSATAEANAVGLRAKLEILESNPNIPRDTIAYLKANLRAAEQQRSFLTKGIKNNSDDTPNALTVSRFSDGFASVLVLKDLHFQARKQLSYDLERYTQIKAVYNTKISAIHVLEEGEPALRKSRPMRSLIVIGSVIAAFLLMVMAALIADTYKDIRIRD